jgi:predicted transcriptional regulator
MRGARRDDGTHPDDPATSRRGAGELEHAVLAVLWSADSALSPGEVRDRLGDTHEAEGLSYSTVVTILTRLHDKGALSRHKDGRAFRYAPVADAAGLAARRLSALLDRQSDRQAVLARFIADLSAADEALLRGLLGPEAAEGAR